MTGSSRFLISISSFLSIVLINQAAGEGVLVLTGYAPGGNLCLLGVGFIATIILILHNDEGITMVKDMRVLLYTCDWSDML